MQMKQAAMTRRTLRGPSGVALALFLGTTAVSAPGLAKNRSNTQESLPEDAFFADVDGNGSADFLETNGTKLVSRTSVFKPAVITDDNLDVAKRIVKVFAGDFAPPGSRERGKQQICALINNGALRCFAISNDLKSMWWWFTHTGMISTSEEVFVGDFDGNGQDDILVYRPSDGRLRMFRLKAEGMFFEAMPFVLGNLSSHDRVNKQIRIGEFGQSSSRSDLLLIDPATRTVKRFDSTIDSSGNVTFWWAFTIPGAYSSSEDATVANIAGQTTDDIACRNRTTGAYRFFKAVYNNGALTPITNVSVGQLPTTAGGRTYWAKASKFNETGGAVRDDSFHINGNSLVRTDARWSSSAQQLTYWWSYSTAPPRYTRRQRLLTDLTAAQRTELSELLRIHITEDVITEHTLGHDWHMSAEPFFYQHRGFITRAEKTLINNGGAVYVPLPMYDPTTTIPEEFRWVKNNADGSARPALTNFSPGLQMPANLAGSNICSIATGDDLAVQTNGWHGSVHIAIGGTMSNASTSPAAVIFWPWHAFVDNIYARWHDCF
jgi:hypothetical protein